MVTATKSFVFLQEKQLRDSNCTAYWDANFATLIKKDRICSHEQVRSSKKSLVLKGIYFSLK